MTATHGAVSRPPFRPCKAFYSNGRTLFLYRYQISGCRSDRDGPAPVEVLKTTDSLDRVRVYSTEDRYIAALPPAIPRFVTRSETRTRLANISLSHQCQPASQRDGEQWYGLELKRKVEVVEKFTLGEGSPRRRSPGIKRQWIASARRIKRTLSSSASTVRKTTARR